MPPAEDSTERQITLSAVLLSILTTIAVVGALKASYSVTMPLAFALFLIILAWPVQKWFAARLPQKVAYGLTPLVMLLVFGVFVGLLVYSTKQVVDTAPKYAEQATQMWQR